MAVGCWVKMFDWFGVSGQKKEVQSLKASVFAWVFVVCLCVCVCVFVCLFVCVCHCAVCVWNFMCVWRERV